MLEVVSRDERMAETMSEAGSGVYRLLFRVLASHPDEMRSFFEDTVAPVVRYDDRYHTAGSAPAGSRPCGGARRSRAPSRSCCTPARGRSPHRRARPSAIVASRVLLASYTHEQTEIRNARLGASERRRDVAARACGRSARQHCSC